MKSTPLNLLAVLALASAPVFAQSTAEKAKATGNDAKREIKKGANRVQETVCTGTKAECEKKKAINRVEETKDKVGDKVEETRDKLDSDKK